ncbi:MAG: hypothetical protein IJ038_07435 [Clostridia bacterium]|nr:hypothetical protein [Clostridia bacterium]
MSEINEREEIKVQNADTENDVKTASVPKQEVKEERPALPPHKEYAKRNLQFHNYYNQLLFAICVAVVLAVAVAVAYNVVIGLSIGAVAAVIYAVFVSDEAYKKLGVKYKSIAGGAAVSACRARYGEVFWLPSRIIGFDVIRIDDRAFSSPKNEELKCVFLPSTLKEIGENIFEDCPSLCEIHFEGSEKDWERIEKKTDFSSLNLKFDAKYPPIPKKKNKKNTAAKKDTAQK